MGVIRPLRRRSTSGSESARADGVLWRTSSASLVETALKALEALKVGNIGLMGATGTVLEASLIKLRDLVDKVASGNTPGHGHDYGAESQAALMNA